MFLSVRDSICGMTGSSPDGTPILAGSAALLYNLTGIQMAFYGPDGIPSKVFNSPEGDSPLCRLIRDAPDGTRRCFECSRVHFARAARRREEVCYTCHAGLTDFAVPIHAGGRHVGTISCGQVLPEPPPSRASPFRRTGSRR